MTDPREPPAAGTPQKSSDIVVEGVDDPRFPLLEAEWPEYGVRIDPATGSTPPPPRAVEQAGPAVVRAPARAPDPDARRRAARVVTVGAILPALIVAAIGGTLVYRALTGGGTARHHAHRVSARPPAFTVSTTVTAHAKAPAGISVTPAGNGGLWYQAAGGSMTRLASADGRVNYRFDTSAAALGLAVSGQSLLAVTETPAGGVLVAHDRGSGAVTSSVPLPGTPVCGFASAAGCDPAVAQGAAWVALDDGVARVDGERAALIAVPGVLAVTSGGRRIWAVTARHLYRLDPATGGVLARSSLRQLSPTALTAGAGAVWVAGVRGGRPVVLRFDGPPGRAPLTIAMPSRVRALAATEHAVWAAIEGGGVRELDPSRNRLAGTTVSLPDQDALLGTRPGQLWAVRLDGGRAEFTRIDLTPAP